ncbi:MAG: hypothetical protein QM640_05540 [Niabella sp.]
MLNRIFKYHITAYSIIEVIVALVIILFLFFIATEFLMNMNKQGFNVQRIEAANALDEYMQTTNAAKDFSTAKTQINGWTVSREVQPFPGADSLISIQYIVYKKDSTLTPLLIRNNIQKNIP